MVDRRRLSGQALRYLAVGAANTLVTYAVFIGLGLVIPAWIAYTVAFLLGLLWVVFGTSRIVFRMKGSPLRLVAFAAWYLLLYGCGQLVIALIHPHGLVQLLITSGAVLIVTTPLAFLGGRFIFDRPTREDPEPR
jgi:putative flippase GtrA